MESKRGVSEQFNLILLIIILLVFFFLVAYLYFTLKGQGGELLERFFNLF